MICPCCNQPWIGTPKVIGNVFMSPQGIALLSPGAAKMVTLLLQGDKTADEISLATGVTKASTIRNRLTEARTMLRVPGWGIRRSGNRYGVERL